MIDARLMSSCLLSALVLLTPWPSSAETVRICVTNSAGDSVHVIDPATNQVVQVIEGIERAHGITFSPDGARVYVSNEADRTLDVFDRESGKLTKKVVLSGRPNNIAVTRDGSRDRRESDSETTEHHRRGTSPQTT